MHGSLPLYKPVISLHFLACAGLWMVESLAAWRSEGQLMNGLCVPQSSSLDLCRTLGHGRTTKSPRSLSMEIRRTAYEWFVCVPQSSSLDLHRTLDHGRTTKSPRSLTMEIRRHVSACVQTGSSMYLNSSRTMDHGRTTHRIFSAEIKRHVTYVCAVLKQWLVVQVFVGLGRSIKLE